MTKTAICIPKVILESMHPLQLGRLFAGYKRMRRRLIGFGLNGVMVYVPRKDAVALVKAEIERRSCK